MALIPSPRSIANPAGANQFLGDVANHHDDQLPEVSPGIVGLSLINATSPLGAPNKANPAGAQTS